MGRTGLFLIIANVAVAAVWLLLKQVWFDGGWIGCDNTDVADYDQCSDRADLMVALGLAAVTLAVGTVLAFAVHGAGRLRARRATR